MTSGRGPGPDKDPPDDVVLATITRDDVASSSAPPMRLGHASVAFTLDTYGHDVPGRQTDAAAAVAALVEGS